tara:strand:- start:173 stop:373 length:201 start_codon:yes stop_codon:yes gene_type:complete
MHYKIKTLAFRCLSLLPNRLGDATYHFLQRIANRTSLKKKIELTKESYQMCLKAFEALKINLNGKR